MPYKQRGKEEAGMIKRAKKEQKEDLQGEGRKKGNHEEAQRGNYGRENKC